MMPDAMVMATIELPTDALNKISIRKAITINGSPLFSSAGPIIFPRPESCKIHLIAPPPAITKRIIPTGLIQV